MSDFQSQLKSGAFAGVKKGGHTFVWMCKIIVPISFLVTLFQWSGWLNQLDFLLNPLTKLINLPAEAALPILTGILINLYAVIAVITAIPFTVEQMTLIAVFNLIAHSLILEGTIQHQSGINGVKASLFRITAAILTVLVISRFFGDTSQSVVLPAHLTVQTPILETLRVWVAGMVSLLVKILGIIMFIMILLETSKAMGWMEYVLRFFRPLMRGIGLSERTAMMWLTAVIFGLFYGGAVIVEEAKKGTLSKEELEALHISIGTNHALVEDPALFAVLGINIFWLWIPRFITAILAVQTYKGINFLRRKLVH